MMEAALSKFIKDSLITTKGIIDSRCISSTYDIETDTYNGITINKQRYLLGSSFDKSNNKFTEIIKRLNKKYNLEIKVTIAPGNSPDGKVVFEKISW